MKKPMIIWLLILLSSSIDTGITVSKNNIITQPITDKYCTVELTEIKEEFDINIAMNEYIKLAPKSYQIWYHTKYYLKEYTNVPIKMAANILRQETGFRGPLDYRYNPHQTSYVGAEGPYQIMPKTGVWISGQQVTSLDLRYDMKLNSYIGIKYLSSLINQYGYIYAAGVYNTGYKKINEYAVNAVNGVIPKKIQQQYKNELKN